MVLRVLGLRTGPTDGVSGRGERALYSPLPNPEHMDSNQGLNVQLREQGTYTIYKYVYVFISIIIIITIFRLVNFIKYFCTVYV